MRVPSIVIALAALASSAAAQTTVTPQGKSPPKANDPIYAEGYVRPPEAIAKLVDAPRESNFTWASPSPGRKYLLHALVQPQNLESMGKKHYNLGGWQIDPMGNRSRAMTSRSTTGYELLDWAANKVIKVELPANARGSTFSSWSPDGNTFAFYAQLPEATHIYLANAATGKSAALTKTSVLATNVQNFEWTADGKSIVAVLVPDARGPEPKDPTIADAVRVRVNENNQLKTRNYAALLTTPYDKKLFEYYNLGQLAIIDVKSRAVTKVGEPGLITALDASPDAKYFRVTYLDQPFSYLLPVANFGNHEVIIDGTGKVLRTMGKRELSEGQPTDVVDPNDPAAGGGGGGGRGRGNVTEWTKRDLSWHPFESGLMFLRSARGDSAAVVAKDSADARANGRTARAGRGGGGGAAAGGGRGAAGDTTEVAATRPDSLILWSPPFTDASMKTLYVTPGPGTITGVSYSDNGRILFVNERVSGATTTDAIYLDENNAKFTVLYGAGGGGAGAFGAGRAGGRGGRGGGGGAGAAFGGLLTKVNNRGQTVVLRSVDGKYVYTDQPEGGAAGARGAGRGGRGGGRGGRGGADAHVTVDKIEIKTGTRTHVYESAVTDMTESAPVPLDDDFTKAISTRQSRSVPPESFLIDVATKQAKQLTTSKNYWPENTGAIHKTVMATRSDGLAIRIRVTLPPTWKEGTRLPALFWFYPSEFENHAAYTASLTGGRGGGGGGRGGADTTGAGTFQTPGERTMSFITAAGYALVENDAPIVASAGKLPNDNYVTDLQWDLYAAVTALDTLGLVDKNRLAIGGHSYGAFSTMNALAHTPYFKAGIAGDGMYNRTLTPNGFQNERRDLWTGQATYLAMSPMLFADKINGAVLMYHSEEDQNVGTDPISSIRMYQALIGQGKTVSLYMYPYEDHGPVALETNLDQWARWVAWLDKYVKNPQQPKPAAVVP